MLLGGGVAGADPAGPTNYQSVVTTIDASNGPPPISVKILGGDAFIVLRASGVAVDVPGYDGEPYLQFHPDGTVAVNDRSPARWLNDARYGALDADIPPSADPSAPPAWRVVGDAGIYAWHDHRIHYMSPQLPRQIDPTLSAVQHVFDWSLPLIVDGDEVVIRGELRWVPSTSPAVPVALVTVAVAVGLALARVIRRGSGLIAVGAGMIAIGVSLPMTLGLPPGADGDGVTILLPALACAVGLAAVVVGRQRHRTGALISLLATVPVVVWLVWLGGAFMRPIVPEPVPVELLRAAMGLALTLVTAAVVSSIALLGRLGAGR